MPQCLEEQKQGLIDSAGAFAVTFRCVSTALRPIACNAVLLRKCYEGHVEIRSKWNILAPHPTPDDRFVIEG